MHKSIRHAEDEKYVEEQLQLLSSSHASEGHASHGDDKENAGLPPDLPQVKSSMASPALVRRKARLPGLTTSQLTSDGTSPPKLSQLLAAKEAASTPHLAPKDFPRTSTYVACDLESSLTEAASEDKDGTPNDSAERRFSTVQQKGTNEVDVSQRISFQEIASSPCERLLRAPILEHPAVTQFEEIARPPLDRTPNLSSTQMFLTTQSRALSRDALPAKAFEGFARPAEPPDRMTGKPLILASEDTSHPRMQSDVSSFDGQASPTHDDRLSHPSAPVLTGTLAPPNSETSILDDLHSIQSELSQRSRWERGEAADAGTEAGLSADSHEVFEDSLPGDASAMVPNAEDVNITQRASDWPSCSHQDHEVMSPSTPSSHQDALGRQSFSHPLDDATENDIVSLKFTSSPFSERQQEVAAEPCSPRPMSRAPPSPLTGRSFQRSLSKRLRFGTEDDLKEESEDAGFWNQVFDVEDPFEIEQENWHLPDADLTLSQIDEGDDKDMADSDDKLPQAQPIPAGVFAGFSTAGNRKLPEPDARAMAKAKKLFEEAQASDRPAEGGNFHSVLPNSAASARERLPASSYTRVNQELSEEESGSDEDTSPPQVVPQFVSFQKANGQSLTLSKAALALAERKMKAWDAQDENERPHANSEGKPGPPVTSSRQSVLSPQSTSTVVPIFTAPPAPIVSKQTASTSSVSTADALSMLRSSELRPEEGDTQNESTITEVSEQLPSLRNNIRPADMSLPPSTPQAFEQRSAADSARGHSPILLSQTTPVPNTAHSQRVHRAMPGGPAPSTMISPLVRPRFDARPSRISLGMTPRSKLPTLGSKQGFKTPFKDASRPSLITTPVGTSSPAILKTSNVPGTPSRGNQQKSAAGLAKADVLAPTRADPSVFALKPSGPRLNLKQYGMLPNQIKSNLSEIPIILGNPLLAADYVFESPAGADLGPFQALEELKCAGATHVDLAWIKNHWLLILWKLAAYVKAKPEETSMWWSFEQVCRQMRYRYEREVNMAQRSAIKRIQEHDSSASLPMVLCVFDVRRSRQTCEEPVEESDGKRQKTSSEQSRYGHVLELTDGWYRIVAHLDGPLTRAVRKGKIRRGVKIALQGAKLESYGSGPSDVLAAFEKSALSLSGNATSLASWDSRLGFHQTAMVATLRSLSADGGAIPCMEIVLTRLFPVAYVDAGHAGNGSGPASGARGANEENEAQLEWEKKAEECKASLQAEAEKQTNILRDIQEMLAIHGAEHLTYDSGSHKHGEADFDGLAADLVDAALATSSAASHLAQALAKIGSSQLQHVINSLTHLVRARLETTSISTRADVESEFLRRCPPRRVRSFRVCRFVDLAGAGEDSRMRRPCKRTVQLTVWDVDSLGGESGERSSALDEVGLGATTGGSGKRQGVVRADDFLVPGGHYRVTNLTPTQRYAWRGPDVEADVFLSTRRDSSWRRLD